MNSISRFRLPRRFAPRNDKCAAVESVAEFHNAVVDGELDEWIQYYYGGQMPVRPVKVVCKGVEKSGIIRNSAKNGGFAANTGSAHYFINNE